jgi:hypothetical protein
MAIDPRAHMNSRTTDIMRPWPRLARLRLSRRISGPISRAPTCRRLKPMMMPDQTFLKGDKQRPTERFLLTA